MILGGGGAARDDAGVVAAVGTATEQMVHKGLDLVEEDVMIGLVLEVAPIEPVLFLALAGGSSAGGSQESIFEALIQSRRLWLRGNGKSKKV